MTKTTMISPKPPRPRTKLSQTAPTLPTQVSGKKATLIVLPEGKTDGNKKFIKWGTVVIHDADSEVTFNQFDCRYKGKQSRLGKYLRDLHAQGVDISDVIKGPLEKEQDELARIMAERLYKTFGARTVALGAQKLSGTKLSIKMVEKWDTKHKSFHQSTYYKMAARILQDNEPAVALNIVNIITGYA